MLGEKNPVFMQACLAQSCDNLEQWQAQWRNSAHCELVSGWPSAELAREMSELELAHQPRARPTSPLPEPASPPLRRRHSDDATTLCMGTPRSGVDVDGWSVATSTDLPTPDRTVSEDTPQQRPRKRARQDQDS